MRSLLKLAHDEGVAGGPASMTALAERYHVKSVTALIQAHDRAQVTGAGPVTFSAPILSGGLAALGGSLSVTINPDATVRFQGHAHDSGADGYHFSIGAVVRAASGRAVALAQSGHVGGTFTPGDRDFDWNTTQPLAAIPVSALADFGNAHLDTHLEYSSDIGSTLTALIGWLAKNAVGALLTPVGIVVVVGAEAASLIATGSLVPGARIAEGVLWMAGPANSLFAIAAEGIASLGSRTREVSQSEYDWANQQVFLGALPPRDQLVLTDTIGPSNRAFTFPRYDGKTTLNMGPASFADPRVFPGKRPGEVFIHELTHACQIAHSSANLSYIAEAISSTVCGMTGGHPYNYGPAGPDYTSFHLEQQAQIVSDWFCGGNSASGKQTGIAMDVNSPYFRYIQDNVRVGVF